MSAGGERTRMGRRKRSGRRVARSLRAKREMIEERRKKNKTAYFPKEVPCATRLLAAWCALVPLLPRSPGRSRSCPHRGRRSKRSFAFPPSRNNRRRGVPLMDESLGRRIMRGVSVGRTGSRECATAPSCLGAVKAVRAPIPGPPRVSMRECAEGFQRE